MEKRANAKETIQEKEGKRNVLLLGITSFINDFSSEMVMPILPMFLASLGASPVFIGLIGGVRDALTNVLKLLFGHYSDNIGKRMPFIYAGYINSAIWKIALAFSTSAWFALAAVSLERLGKGIRDAPRDAMIGQLMPKKTGAGFGLHQALDTGGALLGSIVVAVVMLLMQVDYWVIIAAAGSLTFLTVIPLLAVREPKFRPRNNNFNLSEIKNAIPPHLALFIAISSVFALANFSYMFFIMKAQLTEGPVIPILLYILFNFSFALLSYPIGKYADKVGKRSVLMAGYLLFALVSLGFALGTSLAFYIPLFIIYGISFATVSGTQKAYASDMAPKELKGTAIGTFQMITGLIAIPAGLIAGTIWESFAPEYTFYFGFAAATIAALMLVLVMPPEKQEH
ncbi:MAG: MFS transporter [Candidatus Micrarchaeia archaeon]